MRASSGLHIAQYRTLDPKRWIESPTRAFSFEGAEEANYKRTAKADGHRRAGEILAEAIYALFGAADQRGRGDCRDQTCSVMPQWCEATGVPATSPAAAGVLALVLLAAGARAIRLLAPGKWTESPIS